MPKKSRVEYANVIVDGSAYAHAAYSAGSTFDTIPHRFLCGVFKRRKDRPEARHVIAWDNQASAAERLKIFPDYKRRRLAKPIDFEYLRQRATTIKLLAALGVSQVTSPGWEADDVVATLARTLPGRTLIMSRDQDLLQLLSPAVDVHLKEGKREKLWTIADFRADRGYGPEEFRDWKALAGDPGDDVPGLPGIGPKIATDLITIDPFIVTKVLAGCADTVDLPPELEKYRKKLIDNASLLSTCLALVRLYDVPCTVIKTEFDLERVRALFKENQLRQLWQRIDEWQVK